MQPLFVRIQNLDGEETVVNVADFLGATKRKDDAECPVYWNLQFRDVKGLWNVSEQTAEAVFRLLPGNPVAVLTDQSKTL